MTLRWCIIRAMKNLRSGLARLGYERHTRGPSGNARLHQQVPTQRDWDRLLQSLDEKAESIKKNLEYVRQQQARFGF